MIVRGKARNFSRFENFFTRAVNQKSKKKNNESCFQKKSQFFMYKRCQIKVFITCYEA